MPVSTRSCPMVRAGLLCVRGRDRGHEGHQGCALSLSHKEGRMVSVRRWKFAFVAAMLTVVMALAAPSFGGATRLGVPHVFGVKTARNVKAAAVSNNLYHHRGVGGFGVRAPPIRQIFP